MCSSEPGLQSLSNYKTSAHPIDYEERVSNSLVNTVSLLNIQPFLCILALQLLSEKGVKYQWVLGLSH